MFGVTSQSSLIGPMCFVQSKNSDSHPKCLLGSDFYIKEHLKEYNTKILVVRIVVFDIYVTYSIPGITYCSNVTWTSSEGRYYK